MTNKLKCIRTMGRVKPVEDRSVTAISLLEDAGGRVGTPGRTWSPAPLQKFHLCRTRRKRVGPRKNTDLKDNDSLSGGHSRVSENFVPFSCCFFF